MLFDYAIPKVFGELDEFIRKGKARKLSYGSSGEIPCLNVSRTTSYPVPRCDDLLIYSHYAIEICNQLLRY